MKTLKSVASLIVSTATVLSLSTAAQASCWSNRAICQAICNKDCCNNRLTSSQARETATGTLERFSVTDLKTELAGVPETSPLRTVLTEAVARRRFTSESTPEAISEPIHYQGYGRHGILERSK